MLTDHVWSWDGLLTFRWHPDRLVDLATARTEGEVEGKAWHQASLSTRRVEQQLTQLNRQVDTLTARHTRRTVEPHLELIYESGVFGARPARLPLSIGDPMLVSGAQMVCSMADLFMLYLQGGRVEVALLGTAQIDRFGNLDTTVIGDYTHPKVRLPGSGGACEIAQNACQVFVITRLDRRAFVERLDFCSTPGHLAGPDQRSTLGISGEGPRVVVTDMAVFCFSAETKEMTLSSTSWIHSRTNPGPGGLAPARGAESPADGASHARGTAPHPGGTGPLGIAPLNERPRDMSLIPEISPKEILPLSMRHNFWTWSAQARMRPIPVTRARGVYFWDVEGRRHVDFNSIVMCSNIGHGDPRVVEAIAEQARDLAFAGPNMATKPRALLGQLLAEITPGDLNRFLYTLGGAQNLTRSTSIRLIGFQETGVMLGVGGMCLGWVVKRPGTAERPSYCLIKESYLRYKSLPHK